MTLALTWVNLPRTTQPKPRRTGQQQPKTSAPPFCIKKPPGRYQKTPKKVPPPLKNVPKNPPFVLLPPIGVAGMDPHKPILHQQKSPFYKKKTAVFPMYATLVNHCEPKNQPGCPLPYQKTPGWVTSRVSLPSTTFYNPHTPPAPKQNTERTLTLSSMTFHSLSYLHA